MLFLLEERVMKSHGPHPAGRRRRFAFLGEFPSQAGDRPAVLRL
jgi:hypothetical protein